MPLLDARLAVGAEAHFGNAVAAAGSWLRCVEFLRAKGFAGELLRSAKGSCFAWAKLTRCAAFRIEGFGSPGWAVRTCANPSVWPERSSSGCWATRAGTIERRPIGTGTEWPRWSRIWTRWPSRGRPKRLSAARAPCAGPVKAAAWAGAFGTRFIFDRLDAETGRLAGDVIVVRSVVAAKGTCAFTARGARFGGSFRTESWLAAWAF